MIIPIFVLADSDNNHQAQIEKGRELTENKIGCENLDDEQLEAIGEYLMEQMHPGEFHERMHQMMGMEEGTEYHKNFHINMAKRMYCREGAMMGMMPMMNMMGNNNTMKGRLNPYLSNNYNNSMMNLGLMSFGWFGLIFMILFWVLLIVGIIVLIKWLVDSIKGRAKNKSALDILEERYAKGEISKQEFEEKKKDLA